ARGRDELASRHDRFGPRRIPRLGDFRAALQPSRRRRIRPRPGAADGQDLCVLRRSSTSGLDITEPLNPALEHAPNQLLVFPIKPLTNEAPRSDWQLGGSQPEMTCGFLF